MQKANVFFFTLMLIIILLTVTLVISGLFYVQTETLIRAKEGSNAFSAAQSGIEHTRNSIRTRLPLATTTCNGTTQNSGAVTPTLFTTYSLDDTNYRVVEYWFICTTGPTPDYIRSLYSYRIVSTGTFGGAVRTIIATRP